MCVYMLILIGQFKVYVLLKATLVKSANNNDLTHFLFVQFTEYTLNLCYIMQIVGSIF